MSPTREPTSSTSPHLTLEDLRRSRVHGFDAAGQLRAFDHLSHRCGPCLEAVRAFLEQDEPPLILEAASLDDPAELVNLALREWIDRAPADRAPELRLRRPAHACWTRRWIRHTLGFARFVLEVAHQKTLELPARLALPWSAAALALASDPRLAEIAEKPAFELHALALARHAEMHRRIDDVRTAEALLHDAEQELSRAAPAEDDLERWIHDEIHASVLELRFQLDFSQSASATVSELLEEAARLVRGDVGNAMPGRLAEPLVALGSARLLLNDERAVDTLRDALAAVDAIGPDANPPLRLMALHRLAMAEYQWDDPASAWDRLDQAEDLYLLHATPEIVAQRQWLRGVLHLALGRPGEAVEPLRDALRRYRRLSQPLDAVHTLAALGRAFVELRQPEKFLELQREFHDLLTTPEAHTFTVAHYQKALDAARRMNMDVPHLREVLEKLEVSLRERTH